MANSLFFLLVAVLIAITASSVIKSEQKSKQIPFTLIGSVEGKRFYINHEEISWDRGAYECKINKFELASVTSVAEMQFLNTTLTSINEFSHYWTSGTGMTHFSWQTTGGHFADTLGPIHRYGEQTCLSFRVPDYETVWRSLPCTDSWPVICQSL